MHPRFGFNNLNYGLVGSVIEQVSGQSYPDFLQTRILNPLGLDRTFLKPPLPNTPNVARCYNTLDDATPTPIPGPKAGSDGFAGPGAGMWSCSRDLMKFYRDFLAALKDQLDTKLSSTPSSPFKNLDHLTSPKIYLWRTGLHAGLSYACGWARTTFPSSLGQLGLNLGLSPGGRPVIGKDIAYPKELLFHQGSLPGALASVMLLPETETVILVLSNALARTDVADWVGQLVLQEVLCVPAQGRVDFKAYAERAVAENLKWYSAIAAELSEKRWAGAAKGVGGVCGYVLE